MLSLEMNILVKSFCWCRHLPDELRFNNLGPTDILPQRRTFMRRYKRSLYVKALMRPQPLHDKGPYKTLGAHQW